MAVDDSGLGGGFLGSLPPAARIGILAGGAVLILGIILFFTMGGSEEKDDGYRTVFENLPIAEAGNAKDFLEHEQRIPVKLADHGTTIRVPKDKAEEALVKLAQNNMPSSGIIGYEIFDKGSFISTDFEKKVSLQRAMNGELSRLIKRFDGVEDARVNVVVPEPALFSEEQLPTTASVLIEFNRGGGFAPGSVEAITHLIGSAVPGLKPGNVTIVDTNGLMLSEGQIGLGGEDNKKEFTKQLEQQLQVQRRMEQFLENKIVMMLEKVLGPGNVRATVTGKFDFDRIQRRKRLKQPVMVDDPVNQGKKILSMVAERKITEKSSKVAGGAGASGGKGAGFGSNPTGDPSAAPEDPAGGGEEKTEIPRDTNDRENLQATYNYDNIEELIAQQTGVMISKAISVQFQIPKKEGEGEGEEEAAEGGPAKIDEAAVKEMVAAAIHFEEKDSDGKTLDQLIVKQVKFDDTVYKKLKDEMEKAREGTPLWLFIVIGLVAFLVGGGIGGVLLGKKKAAATDGAFGAGAPGAVPGAPAYAAIPPAGETGAPPAGDAAGAPAQAQEVTRAPVMPPTPDNPFGFLEGVNPQTVAQLLSTERLPTLVAVLAQLEPGQAEDVISLLNPEIQNEVRTRLAQNPVLPPMTQKMVSQSLKKRLASLSTGVG